MFEDILPPTIRAWAYRVYGFAAIGLGALAVADVNTGKASDVLVYVGGALGFVAAGNTPGRRKHRQADDIAPMQD